MQTLSSQSSSRDAGFWASQVQTTRLISSLRDLHTCHGDYCDHCKMVNCPTTVILNQYDVGNHAPDPMAAP